MKAVVAEKADTSMPKLLLKQFLLFILIILTQVIIKLYDVRRDIDKLCSWLENLINLIKNGKS